MIRFESVRIGEIGDVITGKTPKTEVHENFGNDYMFIGPTDLHEHFFITNSEKMISEKGLRSIKGSMLNGVSILVGCIGWDMGNVGVLEGKCATNQQINSITNIDKRYNPLYIYYWLKNKKDFLFQQASVTRTPILNKTNFSEIRISVPAERNEQDKIVNLLIAIDKKIEINNRINTELEAMAKTLYDYWFVQFDFPFDFAQGKPDKDGKPYKTSGGKMVWNEELKREIPDGWEVGELKDIANIIMGQSPPGESYNNEAQGMIFFQGCTDFGNRFPTVRQFTTQPTRYAKEGDILLSVRAPVGTLNIAKENCCIGRGLAALNSKDNCIAYIFGVMVNLKQIFDRRNVDGTTFGSITKDDLFSLTVVKPDKGTLNKYHQIINPAFEKQNKIELENQTLSELRDWLLPMLMNGQVQIMPSH